MRPKKLKRLFLSAFQEMGNYYSNIPEDFNPEDIHEFRLEVKKLRAFMRLLNFSLDHVKKLRFPAEFRLFYTATGQLRNLQLHRIRIHELAKEMNLMQPEIYLQNLHLDQQKQKEAIRKDAVMDIADMENRLLNKLPGKFDDKDFRNFVIHQKLEILAVLSADIRDESLHTCRKLLKDLQYNFKFIEPFLVPVLPAWFIQKENLESLTESLGNFQDICVAKGFFSSLLIHEFAGPEYEVLLAMNNHLEEQQNRLRLLAHQKLAELLQLLQPLSS